MTHDEESKVRNVPAVTIPTDLLAERRLQVLHSYFQWWTEVLTDAYGMEKTKDLAVQWGRQKGIHTANLYQYYLKKKGVAPDDLYALLSEIGRSGDILGEKYKIWIDDHRGFAQTLVCPTQKMFIDLGLGMECCVKQCDAFMDETWKAIPGVAFKRTGRIDRDKVCEWEFWTVK